MLPCYEPLDNRTLLIGMEWTRSSGAWPVLRHVFECGKDSGLIVDVDPLGEAQAYAVGYSFLHGDVTETLTAL